MHVKDRNLLRLIKRFLKVGIIENGNYLTSEYGTPQGSILSPVLANIVIYYLIILEVERIKKTAKGYIEIVNYADDMVLCFQYKQEAEKTYKQLEERLNKCGLELAKDKTSLKNARYTIISHMSDIRRRVYCTMKQALKEIIVYQIPNYLNNGFIEKTYGKSKCLIKLYGAYIILLHYVKHKKPKQQKNSVCKYTKLGRK